MKASVEVSGQDVYLESQCFRVKVIPPQAFETAPDDLCG